LEGCPSG